MTPRQIQIIFYLHFIRSLTTNKGTRQVVHAHAHLCVRMHRGRRESRRDGDGGGGHGRFTAPHFPPLHPSSLLFKFLSEFICGSSGVLSQSFASDRALGDSEFYALEGEQGFG